MADTSTTTSTNPTSSTNSNQLPVINLDELVSDAEKADVDTQVNTETTISPTAESDVTSNEKTEENNTSDISEGVATPTLESAQTPENVDPFEGLNIVLDNTKSSEKPMESNSTTGFVDPFLGKPKESNSSSNSEAVVMNETTGGNTNATVDGGNAATGAEQQINLDAMLATTATITATEPIEPQSTKKKKILLITTGIIGLLALATASYVVFTTMFPSGMGTDLAADITGNPKQDTNTILTGQTGSDLPNPNTDNSYNPEGSNKPEGTDTKVEEKEEETLPADNSVKNFGEEDELPIGNTDTTIKPESGTKEEELGADNTTNEKKDETTTQVKPEVTRVKDELTAKIDGAKQLLALLRSKPNPDQTKELAKIIKEIKGVIEKLTTNNFTNFSEEIEKPVSDISFRYDKLTNEIIGNGQ